MGYNENHFFHVETIVMAMLLNEMEIFYYVVKLGAFSKAARQLNVSNSHVSKKIEKLEQDLGAKLLSRSTRKLTVTEAGERFYQHCERLIEEASMGYNAVNELSQQPSGLLKITAPPALALTVLSPIISQFMRCYPQIKIRLQCDSRVQDIISEGFDLAIRATALQDSNLVARKITTFDNIGVATPQYLTRHGQPQSMADLQQHRLGLYHEYQHHDTLIVNNKTQSAQTVFSCNSLNMVLDMTLASQCISLQPDYMVKPLITAKKLKPILANSKTHSSIYAVYPSREFIPLKLSLFLATLTNFQSA